MPGITQPIRFQGQWADEETGLYYNRHRYYDPDMGRYITSDPIGLAGGLNEYGYVINPSKLVDPLGLSGEEGIFKRAFKDIPRMFVQFVKQAVLPTKETAQTVSNVTAVCSLAPPATLFAEPYQRVVAYMLLA